MRGREVIRQCRGACTVDETAAHGEPAGGVNRFCQIQNSDLYHTSVHAEDKCNNCYNDIGNDLFCVKPPSSLSSCLMRTCNITRSSSTSMGLFVVFLISFLLNVSCVHAFVENGPRGKELAFSSPSLTLLSPPHVVHAKDPYLSARGALCPTSQRQAVSLFLKNDEHDEAERRIASRLFMSFSDGNNSTDQTGGSWWNKLLRSASALDPSLFTIDILAVLVASQLLGLLDVLNDPFFYYNGGWLQPVPAVPSTLGLLAVRTASLSVSWIIATVVSKWMETENDPDLEENDSFAYRLFYDTSRTWAIFMAARVTFTTTFLTMPIDAPMLLLQGYVVGLCVPAFRWLLYGRI